MPMLVKGMPIPVIGFVVFPRGGALRGGLRRRPVVPVLMDRMPVTVVGLVVFPRVRGLSRTVPRPEYGEQYAAGKQTKNERRGEVGSAPARLSRCRALLRKPGAAILKSASAAAGTRRVAVG